MLANELGWLCGYPTGPLQGGLGWQVMPTDDAPWTLVVDRDRLHQANWAMRQIHRDHLAVLESVLDEPPARWRARTQRTLDLLGEPVHEGSLAPDPWSAEELWEPRLRDRARVLPAALRPLAQALGWRWPAAPASARLILDVLEQAPERWARLLARTDGLRLAMLLCGWMVQDRPERVEPALTLLLLPTDGVVSWREHHSWCAALLKQVDRQSEPENQPAVADEPWESLLEQQLVALAGLRRSERRRGLAAMALLRPPAAENQAWWRRYRALQEDVAELPEAPPSSRKRRKASLPDGWRDSLRARITTLQDDVPMPWRTTEALLAVSAVARSERLGPLLLEKLPLLRPLEGLDAVAAFLVAWTIPEEGPRLRRHVARWIRSLERAVACERLAQWSLVWDEELKLWSTRTPPFPSRPRWRPLLEPDDTLMDNDEVATGRFYDWLDAEPRVMSSLRAQKLAEIFALTADPELALRALEAQADDWLHTENLKALIVICGALTAARVRPLINDGSTALAPLAGAVSWLSARGHAGRLERLPLRDLIELGRALALLETCGASPPDLADCSEDTRWIMDFPPALHPVLTDLARWRPDAARWAAQARDELSPPDPCLDQEIAAIEARISPEDGDTPLRRRLASLRARRAGPRGLDARQTRKLAERAIATADRALMVSFLEPTRAHAQSALRVTLGLDTLPDWLARPDLIQAAAALSDTSGEIRALAFRVLRRRAGPPPWDLREEAPNQRFLEGLRGRGVNVEPWLAERQLQVAMPGGGPVTLSLEPDPLEILQMGAHFGTCLTPGNANYYSAVVNAADINKRVVYARGPDGRVVGRCLLALTDAGDLLAFEPYCHRAELDFRAQMASFAEGLARDMGVTVLGEGEVRRLMATRWYDDGPQDLFGAKGRLAPEGPLATHLETLEADALLPTLRAELHPSRLDASALSRLIALPVVQRRADLLLTLAPEIRAARALSMLDRACAAAALMRAGERTQARLLLPTLREGGLGGLCCGYQQWGDELVELDPFFVLDILKRRGEHDFEPSDAWYSGRALEVLGRPVQALERYRQALEICWPGSRFPWQGEARERIAKLELRRQAQRQA